MTKIRFSDSDLQYLIALVDQAGAAIMKIYQDPELFASGQTAKIDRSPLTQADLVANQILVKGLKNRWPAVKILSEEGADSFEAHEEPVCYWAVDPLDGTKEFIKRNGEFTVNVALIYLGKPIVGIVQAPALNSLYLGCNISEAVCIKDAPVAQKRNRGTWERIAVSSKDRSNLTRPIRVVTSRSHPSEQLQSWLKQYPNHELLEVGSSLKFCYVAEGNADLYPRLGPTCIWDTAAGHAIVLAAGGVIKGIGSSNMQYLRPRKAINSFFTASSSAFVWDI